MDKKQELALLRAELAERELAVRRYSYYLPYVHGKTWKKTKMSDFLAERVQSFIEEDTGRAYDILVIETPPQHGKSMTITESLPSWYLGKRPNDRIILASYNDDFAERFCRKNKDKIKAYGNQLFHITLSVERAEELELSNGVGRLISRGIRSGITGNPANLVIIDDPIKNREEADSPTYRAKIWEEWQNSIKTRLSAGAKVILIMTPWHEDDLAARIMASEHNVTLLRLPVEAEENDPLGRRPGAALAPELGKDDAWLADFKPSYISDPQGGARAWAALYQCSPRVEGGNLVQRSWWKYYEPSLAPTFATELISVDAAFKGTTESDFVAITVWGKIENDYYLRYCLNRQMTFTETLQALRLTQKLYPYARRVLIEDKANGSAIIDVLQKEMFCIPVNPKGGKEARVNAVSPAIESGHVYLPSGEPWVEGFINQFALFPAGAHDDMVDSATQALSFMLFSTGYVPAPAPVEVKEIRTATEKEEHTFLGPELYDVYGTKDGWTS
jgi:predicted phage terminase large subunit-like protein